LKWKKDENIRNASYWLARKIELIELKHHHMVNNIKSSIFRGGIFNVELGEGNIGGEKNKKRPCLVISHNNLNKGDTVVVIPLTTKFPYDLVDGVKIPKYKNHYIFYKANYSFLDNDSCIKCEDIRMVDKVRVKEHLGNISVTHLDKLLSPIKFTLGFK
jgi:mRNA interferase MazF